MSRECIDNIQIGDTLTYQYFAGGRYHGGEAIIDRIDRESYTAFHGISTGNELPKGSRVYLVKNWIIRVKKK